MNAHQSNQTPACQEKSVTSFAPIIEANWNARPECVLVSSLRAGRRGRTISGEIIIATGRTYKDIPGDCPVIRYEDGRETIMTTMAKVVPICGKCTDTLTGHEDEGGGLCRFCKTCVSSDAAIAEGGAA